MAQLIAGGNFAEAERLAHNLVGVAGGFGAEALAQCAAALEAALENLETSELESLQEDVRCALTDVLDEARQFKVS